MIFWSRYDFPAHIICRKVTNAFLQEYGERRPTLSFLHIGPGGVDTPLANGTWITRLLTPIARPFLRSPADCAEWMLYPLFNADVGSGASYLDIYGEQIPIAKNATEEAGKKLWDHSVSITNVG